MTDAAPAKRRPPAGARATGHRDHAVAVAASTLFALVGGPAGAQTAAGTRLEAFPVGHFYPLPIADPHRAAFGLALREVHDASVADSSSTRYDLRVGGTFGMLRWTPARTRRGFQLDLIAGINALFDVDESYDNIAWDGNYGLQVSTLLTLALAAKIGIVHTSAHLGDELIERTGRERIGYTREELVVGLRRGIGPGLAVYGEAGYGYELRNRELQEPWRLQVGAELDPTRARGGPSQAWFVAVDVSATEERDFRLDAALKAGRTFRVAERRWRVGVEVYDGRPNAGELFQDTEAHVAAGLWLDL